MCYSVYMNTSQKIVLGVLFVIAVLSGIYSIRTGKFFSGQTESGDIANQENSVDTHSEQDIPESFDSAMGLPEYNGTLFDTDPDQQTDPLSPEQFTRYLVEKFNMTSGSMCEFKEAQAGMTTQIFYADNAMRIEMKTEGVPSNILLFSGNTLYSWIGGESEGISIRQGSYHSYVMRMMDAMLDDLLDEYSPECRPFSTDEVDMKIPSDVTFIDSEEM